MDHWPTTHKLYPATPITHPTLSPASSSRNHITQLLPPTTSPRHTDTPRNTLPLPLPPGLHISRVGVFVVCVCRVCEDVVLVLFVCCMCVVCELCALCVSCVCVACESCVCHVCVVCLLRV
eukprot:GHVQ01027753.1.p3 GENE.GHVQ01027753.1~~GHVQ01027753.1.p3  ORF type:complete len:121 (-),score=24.74 GHVQ01027753.1:1020-1382(-)